jgi:hypothetical protein
VRLRDVPMVENNGCDSVHFTIDGSNGPAVLQATSCGLEIANEHRRILRRDHRRQQFDGRRDVDERAIVNVSRR